MLKRSGFGTTNALSSIRNYGPQGKRDFTHHPTRFSVLSAEAHSKRYPSNAAVSTGFPPHPLRTNADRSTEFRDVLVEADAREAIPQPATEGNSSAFFSINGTTQNVTHFFLDAVPMTICPTSKPSFEVFFEISDNQLSHITSRTALHFQ